MEIYILIACEESQAECRAFRELGFEAYSCDVKPCRRGGNPDWHIQGDVTPFLKGETQFVTQSGKKRSVPRWTLIIAHPPCTYLCRVGAIHLMRNPDYSVIDNGKEKRVNFHRWCKLKEARDFFRTCMQAQAPYVAVENPVPLAIARLPPPSCFVQPFWFGVKYSKKTLFWLKNLPPIMPQLIYPDAKSFVYYSRGHYRSRTFPEMAKAIAQQWSEYIMNDMKQNEK